MLAGHWLGIAANILWGTSFLASAYTLRDFGPFSATVLRFGLASIVMLVAFPLFNLKISFPKINEWPKIAIISFFAFGVLYPSQLTGLQSISSGFSAAIMLTSPVFAIVFGYAFLNESIGKAKLVALVMGILGGLLLITGRAGSSVLPPRDSDIFGILMTFLASASLAASIIVTKKFTMDKISVHNLTFWTIVVGILMLLPFAWQEILVLPPTAMSVSSSSIISLLYLATVCSALCFLMWNKAISLLPANELASSMHIKTPAAIILGLLDFTELTPAISLN